MNATVAQCKRLHVKCSLDERWDIFDYDLPGDVESSECSTLNEVSRVVGFPRKDRKDFDVSHIHAGLRKSRSICQAPMNRAWSMLVKKPARSCLMRMRSPSTGAALQDGTKSVYLLTRSGLGTPPE